MSEKKHSVMNIIEGVVVAVLIILIAGMLFLYFSFSETGAAPEIFGMTICHTKAVNMEPIIHQGTAVIGKKSAIDEIQVGDTVICRIGEDTVITRVERLSSENGEMSYVVKFVTAPADDTFKISRENIVAKAIWQNKILGSLITFATSTAGIMLVIIIPSFVIIVFQVIRIINVRKAEEEAYSLDDLEEIMIRDDDEESGEILFSEPAPKEPSVMKPIQPDIPYDNDSGEILFDGPAHGVKLKKEPVPDNAPAGGDGSDILFDDPAPRVELDNQPASSKTAEENVPLFSYDKIYGRNGRVTESPVVAREQSPVTAEVQPGAVRSEKARPVTVPVRPVQTAAQDKPRAGAASTVSTAGAQMPKAAEAPKKAAVKPTVRPKSNTPVKNSEDAFAELMSMIDMEESKLK